MDLKDLMPPYWAAIEAAKKGDRAPLVALLMAGTVPDRREMKVLAEFIDHKPKMGRPLNSKGASERIARIMTDKRVLALHVHRRRMAVLKEHGNLKYGMKKQIIAEVCAEFGFDNVKQFTTWYNNQSPKKKKPRTIEQKNDPS